MKNKSSFFRNLILISILILCLFDVGNSFSQVLPPPYNLEVLFNNMITPSVDITWDHDNDTVDYFLVERDGVQIGTTPWYLHFFTDNLPDTGTYCYDVYAVYLSGTSDPAGPECIDYYIEPEIIVFPEFLEYTMDLASPIYIHYLGISNVGRDTLDFTFSGFTGPVPPPGFITDVDPDSGSLNFPGADADCDVTWNCTGYSPGTYYQDLIVESNDPNNPAELVPNIMHVGPLSYFSGIIIDGANQIPVSGAEVSAMGQQTETLSDGSYLLRVPINSTFDLNVEMLGYETLTIPVTSGVAWSTYTLDTSLIPLQNTVPWVVASTDCNDPAPADLSWAPPQVYREILYDDGLCEDLYAMEMAYEENALMFTPPDYPVQVFGGRVYVGRGAYPSGSWLNSTIAILVYGEDPVGMPGNVLDSISVMVTDYEWVEFYGLDAQIDSGNFFISMMQLNAMPNTPPIGISSDSISTIMDRSYTRSQGGTWELSAHQNFMIRTMIEYESDSISNYSIARVSGFDPNLGPQTGTLTYLTDTMSLNYQDTNFTWVLDGWYAYAVQANYTFGQSSDWTYSNIIGHDKGKIVEFNVMDCNGNPIDSIAVTMVGEDWPYEIFQGPPFDTIWPRFECVWLGYYDILIEKAAYTPLYLENVYIGTDTIFTIELDSVYYPPQNLWVDSISGTAYWEGPIAPANPEDYGVYLDYAFVGTTAITFYQYEYLTYGHSYTACVDARYPCGSSEQVCVEFTSAYLKATGWLEGDTVGTDAELSWFMDTAYISGNILGYYLYRDSLNLAFIPYIGEDTSFYTDTNLQPQCYDYYVSTVYDLTAYGFAGDTGESIYTGPEEVCIVLGDALPIHEDWSSGVFGSFWTVEDNWIINGQMGNPEPATEFTWNPVLIDYQSSLTSDYINGVYKDSTRSAYTDGEFIMDFDLELDDVSLSGTEFLNVEIWSAGEWNSAAQYNNSNGSLNWLYESLNITQYALGHVFKLRFTAEGENSGNILSWFVDNIEVYHYCTPPHSLLADQWIYYPDILLQWNSPGTSSLGYNIYRVIGDSIYEFIDYTEDTSYVYEYQGGSLFSFVVTAEYESCESGPSNEASVIVGIEDNIMSDGIWVYPNPFREFTTFYCDFNTSSDIIIRIYDSKGQMLDEINQEKPIGAQKLQWNANGLPEGMYLYRIQAGEKLIVGKMVLMR